MKYWSPKTSSPIGPKRLTTQNWLVAIGIFLVAVGFRVPDLDNRLNIDAAPWNHRADQYWEAVTSGDWRSTYQSNHPGVTLMWVIGLARKITNSPRRPVTPRMIVAVKTPIALLGALLAPFTFLALRRLFSDQINIVPLLTGVLIATEPILVAHSRSFHLDMLVSAFGWYAVLATALLVYTGHARWAIAAGLTIGLGCLSKFTNAPLFIAISLWLLVAWFDRWHQSASTDHWYAGRQWLLFTFVSCLTFFILWPVMLIDPLDTLMQALINVRTVALGGHDNFLWGESVREPGVAYYAAVILMRTTPEVMWPALCGLVVITVSPRFRWIRTITFVYLPLAVILAVSSKKGDRYLISIYPLICTLGAVGIYELGRSILRAFSSNRIKPALALSTVLIIFLLAGRSARLVGAHPLPISWCAKYPGIQCEQAITLGWGEGMKEVGQWIESQSRSVAPTVYPDWGYVHTMHPWFRPKFVPSPEKATFLVRYLSEAQRSRYVDSMRPFIDGALPVFVARLDGRAYAEVFLGPDHPDFSIERSNRKLHTEGIIGTSEVTGY